MTTIDAARHTMPEVFTGLKVIDVDTHFTEPPDLWTARAPAKYEGMVPHMKQVDGVDRWFFNDEPMAPVGFTVITRGRQKRHGIVSVDRFEETDESTWDARARLQLMDEMGIWGQVVFPNIAGFGGATIGKVVPEDNRNHCIRDYNDAVAEWASGSGGRLRPQALIPFWDIKESAREAERTHALGMRGITATSAPEAWGDGLPDYGDPAWDPFWEVCSDLNIPISFHIASSSMPDNLAPWKSFGYDAEAGAAKRAEERGSRQMAPTAASVVTGTLLNSRIMVNIIYSGLLDRWPKLKFASIESGLGWIPFFLELAEYQFDEFTFEDRWGLKRRPAEYFRDHFYASYWFEDHGPRHAIEMVGPQSVLWETDFPHPTCLWPDPLERSADALAAYPYEWRKAIMQDNAAQLWDFPLA